MTCILCRACYYIGDRWLRIVNCWPDAWERSGVAMAEVYQFFMRHSLRVDDKANCGAWDDVSAGAPGLAISAGASDE